MNGLKELEKLRMDVIGKCYDKTSMNKIMNIILCNCGINSDNKGVAALAVSVMSIIGKILEEKDVKCTFYLAQGGYKKYEEHTEKIGGLEIKYYSFRDIASRSIKSCFANIVFYKEYTKAKGIYKKADYIFDIAGGDSFADIYGIRRFNHIMDIVRLGMKYKKPYCLLPQTIGPFNFPNSPERAKKVIDFARCVMTRDSQSFVYVKELLPNKPITEIIDVAFFMPFKRKEFDNDHIHVGLNISALLWHNGYTGDNQFGLKCDYHQIVRNIINYFLSQDGVKLHLVPHVVGSERHVENDYAVSYDLYEEYGNPNLILSPLFLDPISAKNYIAGMDFFMGARMHSTIAAFSSGVPVVPMAYSRKFNGLCIDTLQYPNVVDMKKQLDESILSAIQSAYSQRTVLKNMIAERMSTIVAERGRLLEKKLKEFMGLN